jgi:hypothetical protein
VFRLTRRAFVHQVSYWTVTAVLGHVDLGKIRGITFGKMLRNFVYAENRTRHFDSLLSGCCDAWLLRLLLGARLALGSLSGCQFRSGGPALRGRRRVVKFLLIIKCSYTL